MKVALVYDRVNKWGGAERVLLALHELFPESPLYTSVYSNESAKWASIFPKIYTSPLQKIKYFQTHHEVVPFLMPFVFENFDFSDYDLVISVTSESAKGIITSGHTKHICYCLTPTRYLWSGHESYFPTKFKKTISSPILNYLRKWDLVASGRPDKMIAISTEVQKRIKKYYNRDSEIIFPPFSFNLPRQPKAVRKNFYLLVSRLVHYKKVDLAIDTFNNIGEILIIIGTGSEEGKLKAKARGNIHFIKNLTDAKLAHYYKSCKALIFPQEEDFGLVAVEAQYFGTPIIAYKKGGALDIIKDRKTGIFFDKQNTESLSKAIIEFEQMKFDRKVIMENAKRFSKERFQEEFLEVIKKI